MAKPRMSVAKRQREQAKRDRQSKKAEKRAQRADGTPQDDEFGEVVRETAEVDVPLASETE